MHIALSETDAYRAELKPTLNVGAGPGAFFAAGRYFSRGIVTASGEDVAATADVSLDASLHIFDFGRRSALNDYTIALTRLHETSLSVIRLKAITEVTAAVVERQLRQQLQDAGNDWLHQVQTLRDGVASMGDTFQSAMSVDFIDSVADVANAAMLDNQFRIFSIERDLRLICGISGDTPFAVEAVDLDELYSRMALLPTSSREKEIAEAGELVASSQERFRESREHPAAIITGYVSGRAARGTGGTDIGTLAGVNFTLTFPLLDPLSRASKFISKAQHEQAAVLSANARAASTVTKQMEPRLVSAQQARLQLTRTAVARCSATLLRSSTRQQLGLFTARELTTLAGDCFARRRELTELAVAHYGAIIRTKFAGLMEYDALRVLSLLSTAVIAPWLRAAAQE